MPRGRTQKKPATQPAFETEKEVAAVKAETVNVAALEEKAPAKQTAKTATRTTKKVELVCIQSAGREWDVAEITKKAKEDYVARGNKASSVKKFCVYVKPEEGMAYYVVNDADTGSVEL